MTNGQALRVLAAMKPYFDGAAGLATIDMATGEEAVAIHHWWPLRLCAVPASGVVVETMAVAGLAGATLE